MTGDAPMGFSHPLPPRSRCWGRWLDGAARDGTRITKTMKAEVSRQLQDGGDLYLIADTTDMGRARDALADYDLAIRWTECQQFDTNLVGIYQWCPLARKS